ncbi:MAG: hypothetical protein QOH63_3318 [Acidobacteriota bacterium]|jgi:hypothetical protein|nr:hypothetical protein [Acidobacteriota bacterium]
MNAATISSEQTSKGHSVSISRADYTISLCLCVSVATLNF